ncbi:MAG: hypothetical protein ACI90R_002377, partial [Alteromonas macleodii]
SDKAPAGLFGAKTGERNWRSTRQNAYRLKDASLTYAKVSTLAPNAGFEDDDFGTSEADSSN